MAQKTSNLSKRNYLKQRLSELPDFVFSYIEEDYSGESVSTQLGYSIDIATFLRFLKLYRFQNVNLLSDFDIEHLKKVTAEDFVHFKSYLKEYEITLTSADGKERKRLVTNSAYGINRKLSAVRGLFCYLYRIDKLPQNVTDKVTTADLKQKIKKPLTTQETVRFLNILFDGKCEIPDGDTTKISQFEGRDLTEYKKRRQRDIAMYVTYLGTGVRVSELVNLNLSKLYFDNYSNTFIVTRKGGDEQEIFMPPQVCEELKNYVEQRKKIDAIDKDALFIGRNKKRLTIAAVELNLKKYCNMAGIFDPDKTRPHALRRTFACQLLEDGIDIKMVAELMGHKNIEVTHKFYAKYSQKAKKEVMDAHKIVPEN